ncbi:hypothetical protein AKJ65_06855, partial [candidate division MSBL1 archaeon SCGC-AAA259E19]
MENKDKTGDDNKNILILIAIIVVAVAIVGGYFLLSGDGGEGGAGGIPTPSGFSSYDYPIQSETLPEGVEATAYMTTEDMTSQEATDTFVSSLEDSGWTSAAEMTSVGAYTGTYLEKGDQGAVVWSTSTPQGIITIVATGPKSEVTGETGGEPGQADISVTSGGIIAPPAGTGEDTTITVSVVNLGSASGTEDIDLKVDGEVVDTETVSLDAGGTEMVKFTVHKSTPGEYTVTALGETTTWTVTEEETGEGGYSGTGTSTYSGTWSGEGPQAEYEGTWEFTVDWETGDVTGLFKGDASGDISGSVSNGEITAEGEAGFGMISWSGSFAADGSEISGEWEDTQLGVYSGTWSGQEGELKEETGGETGGEETEATVDWATTVDYTVTQTDNSTGDVLLETRVRARNLDTATPDIRVDRTTAGMETHYILKGSEGKGWIKGLSDTGSIYEEWTQFSEISDISFGSTDESGTAWEKWYDDELVNRLKYGVDGGPLNEMEGSSYA